MRHSWLKDVNFEKLMKKELKGEYVVQNVDENEEYRRLVEMSKENDVAGSKMELLDEKVQEMFKGYDQN